MYFDAHRRGIHSIIHNGRAGETYNIGGNNEWANIDTIELLCKIVDGKFAEIDELKIRFPDSPCATGAASISLITHVTDRPGHDTRYAVDAGKIMSELDYQPLEDFESGLHKTVDWYLNNEPWWQAILDGSYRN